VLTIDQECRLSQKNFSPSKQMVNSFDRIFWGGPNIRQGMPDARKTRSGLTIVFSPKVLGHYFSGTAWVIINYNFFFNFSNFYAKHCSFDKRKLSQLFILYTGLASINYIDMCSIVLYKKGSLLFTNIKEFELYVCILVYFYAGCP